MGLLNQVFPALLISPDKTIGPRLCVYDWRLQMLGHFADRPELEGRFYLLETDFGLWGIQTLHAPKVGDVRDQ